MSRPALLSATLVVCTMNGCSLQKPEEEMVRQQIEYYESLEPYPAIHQDRTCPERYYFPVVRDVYRAVESDPLWTQSADYLVSYQNDMNDYFSLSWEERQEIGTDPLHGNIHLDQYSSIKSRLGLDKISIT